MNDLIKINITLKAIIFSDIVKIIREIDCQTRIAFTKIKDDLYCPVIIFDDDFLWIQKNEIPFFTESCIDKDKTCINITM